MFANQVYGTKGLEKGYRPDAKVSADNSIIDCLNLSFKPFETERRLPYRSYLNLSAVLPASYSIIGFTITKFTDGEGNVQECVIIAAKNTALSSSETRIYINNWYSPAAGPLGYDNWQGYAGSSASEWVSGWVELTERLTLPAAGRTVGNGSPGAMTKDISYATTTGFNSTDGYYAGWWIFNSSNECIGMVTNYDYTAGVGVEFNAVTVPVLTSETAIANSTFDGSAYTLARFPVNVRNLNQWDDITSVKFEKGPNNVKIACGIDSKALEIVFIQQKASFNSLELHPSNADYRCHGNWNGLYFGFTEIEADSKDDVITVKSNNDGTANKPWETAGPTYGYNALWLHQGSSYSYSGTANSYFAYVSFAEMGILLKFEMSYKLHYYSDGANSKYGDDADPNAGIEDLWGLALEYSGYQAIFLKMLLTKKFTVTISSDEWRFKSLVQSLNPIFRPDFDRRINATLLFYEDRVDYAGVDEKGLDPKQLSERYHGRTSINSDEYSKDLTNNFWTVNLVTQGQGFTNSFGRYTEPSDWDLENEFREDFFRDPENSNGLTVNSYLNGLYYKNAYIKAKEFIRVGRNLVGINISNDSVATDTELRKNGLYKIAGSRIQNDDVYADGLFIDERVRQITTTEELTGGASINEEGFLVFSENGLYWREINDIKSFTLDEKQDFAFRGAYSNKSIVKAQIGDQFAGVYWISKNSIYRFINNAPEDILLDLQTYESLWRDTYQRSFTDEQKRNAIGGFNPRTREVWFLIGSYIYVWSILYENWSIYQISDAPAYYESGFDEELYWVSGNRIYATELPTTTRYKDETSGGDAAIPFYATGKRGDEAYVNNKILDRFDIIYEITPETSGGETLTCQLKMQAGVNGSVTNIFDGTAKNGLFDAVNLAAPSKFKKTQNARIRKRANYFTWKLSSVSANEGNIKTFKLKELVFNVKQGGRKMDKI